MNRTILFLLSALCLYSPLCAEITRHQDLIMSLNPMTQKEKLRYFSCLNPVKSRHLASKYTLFKLSVKNKSLTSYTIDAAHSGLDLMTPERLAQRVEINRSWFATALATLSAVTLSSIFYIAYVPCVTIALTLGACAATINPHKTSRKNKQKMLGSVLDYQHETVIPSCSQLNKVIALRTKKNRSKSGKTGILKFKKSESNEVFELKFTI